MWSMPTLRRIAVIGGFSSLTGAWYLRKRIEENFHTQGFYDISIEVMLKFPPIIELLGRPLTASKVDLGDTTKNWTDGLNAQLAIPLQGANGKATLVSWISRPKFGDTWDVDRLDIAFKKTPQRTFYMKPQSQTTEVENSDISVVDSQQSQMTYVK